jgi:hypothetical protein
MATGAAPEAAPLTFIFPSGNPYYFAYRFEFAYVSLSMS